MTSIPRLLTAGELSALLNVSELTIRKLVKTKQIPCMRVKRQVRFDFNTLLKHFRKLEGGAA